MTERVGRECELSYAISRRLKKLRAQRSILQNTRSGENVL